MIYLQNITTSQVLLIPKNGMSINGNLTLKAKSTIDLTTNINAVVTDLQSSSIFFNVAVVLPSGMQDGEYEYTLSDSTQVISTGIMRIGNDGVQPSQYNKVITYEQYENE